MSSDGGGGEGAEGAGAGAGAGEGGAGRVLHARSFKLRFAAQREPGRSYVSAVKPLALPATVTDKFYSARCEGGAAGEGGEAGEGVAAGEAGEGVAAGEGGAAGACGREERALRRIRAMFRCGPRERHPAPLTAAHEYGWWAAAGGGVGGGGGPRHHIRDSAWLAARLRVLAADDKLKHK